MESSETDEEPQIVGSEPEDLDTDSEEDVQSFEEDTEEDSDDDETKKFEGIPEDDSDDDEDVGGELADKTAPKLVCQCKWKKPKGTPETSEVSEEEDEN